jgi:hypothetical protein
VLTNLPPVDPGANKEGDEKSPCDAPVKTRRRSKRGRDGSVASAIEKLEKSKEVVNESIVTRELNKKKSYAV